MPRALVTGATGLVGSHIVERLVAERWTVRAMLRGGVGARGAESGDAGANHLRTLGVELVDGDILDAAAFAWAATACDIVFHTAAVITPHGGWEEFRRVNIDGTLNAIAAAQAAGARLLQLSSVAVYGAGARYALAGRTTEDTPLTPLPERAWYARSKRESETLVLAAHAEGRIWATAVRPCVIYGRRDRQFVPRIARLLRGGVAPVIGSGRNTLAVVHAANVADGAVRAATSEIAGGRAYNLANDFDVTLERFYRLAAQGLDRRVRAVHVPVRAAAAALRATKVAARVLTGGRFNVVGSASLDFITRDNPFSSERARRELGWAPLVRPDEGIPDAFRWWRTHQPMRPT